MAFRFKDLMVEVLGAADPANATCGTISMDPVKANATCPTLSMPERQFAVGGGTTGIICPTLSLTPTPYAITAIFTTGTICGTLTMPGMARGTENLTTLKQQLQQALQQVEEQERAAAGEAGLPRTAEEADDLERRLREALEELQAHRKTLQKPAKQRAKAGKGKK